MRAQEGNEGKVIAIETIPARKSSQNQLDEEVAASFGAALEHLSRAYEADRDHRRDLLQEIHIALWRSLGTFDHRCSLRTWTYRVAHNVGASHLARQYRNRSRSLAGYLDELETQRKLVSNLWWYLGPLVPGLVLSMVSSAIAHPQPKSLVMLAGVNAIIAGSFYRLIKLNSQAARCLQKQIDELRGLREAR